MKPTILVILAAAFIAGETSADTITLRSSVRVPNATVTLKDIADLDGEAAQQLGDLEIATITSGAHEITVRTVREELNKAGVHWGRLNLNGSKVIVRAARDSASAPPMAMAPISLDADETAAPKRGDRDDVLASELVAMPTVRGTIANLIATNLRLNPNELRLRFDKTDADILDVRVESARIEVQPLSSFASDRIELTVRMWNALEVRDSRNVSVLPLFRVLCAQASRDVAKDHVIGADDVVDVEQWLPPSQASLVVNRITTIGRVASGPLKAGEALRTRDVRRDTLVKRGDVAIVRCLVGGAVLSLQAEARSDGGEGEVIEFRKPGERETFRATVTGRNEAIVDLSRR